MSILIISAFHVQQEGYRRFMTLQYRVMKIRTNIIRSNTLTCCRHAGINEEHSRTRIRNTLRQ